MASGSLAIQLVSPPEQNAELLRLQSGAAEQAPGIGQRVAEQARQRESEVRAAQQRASEHRDSARVQIALAEDERQRAAVDVDAQRRDAIERQIDLRWIGARLDDKVVHDAPLVAVVDEIDSGIKGGVRDTTVVRHIAMPPGGIAAGEVIRSPRFLVRSRQLHRFVRACEAHTDDIRRPVSRPRAHHDFRRREVKRRRA